MSRLVSGWPSAMLARLVPSDDKINYGVVQPGDHHAGGVPLIRVGDLEKGVVRRETLKQIDPEIEAAYSRSRLRGDEVLLACVGSIGTVAISDASLSGCNVARAVARIRCGERLDRRFLGWYLRTDECQRYFQSEARTVAQPTLNIRQIESLEVPVPPLDEQRRIADILDKADAIRRKRKEVIALTEELFRSAFLEMFGDPVTNPKGWPIRALSEMAEVASGVAKGKKYDAQTTVEVPYMRVANVQDGHLVLDEVKSIRVSEEEARRYLLRSGDVLLTEGGDPDKLGRGTVWRDEVPRCIHQNHIFRVRANEHVVPEYLSALIGSEGGKRYFLRAAKQTTGIATINSTQLKAFPVLVPPKKLQLHYLSVARATESLRGNLADASRVEGELFDSLVQQAFRGELSTPSKGNRQLSLL